MTRLATSTPLGPAVLAGAVVLMGACQAQPSAPAGSTVPHQVLEAGGHCGTSGTSVQRIVDAAQLKQAAAARSPDAAPTTPAVDFGRSLVLRVSMGQQPNPGHGMGVTGARLDAGSRRLVIETVWTQPEPGRMYAAVVTQPCVIIAVPLGDYRSVSVVDAQGRERATAPLTATR